MPTSMPSKEQQIDTLLRQLNNCAAKCNYTFRYARADAAYLYELMNMPEGVAIEQHDGVAVMVRDGSNRPA